jgi:acyl-coenzyme A thioesterase PaaI-like protein
MDKLLILFSKAKRSRAALAFLNYVLAYSIPFNRPHGIKITAVHDDGVSVRMPYKRKNLNHLKGIHACALATAAEFTSGVLLLTSIGTGFRLIMKNISVTYHYQAKMDVITNLIIDKKIIEEKILLPLETSDMVFFENTVEVHDLMANHICTAVVLWQVKKWKAVTINN